MWSVVPVVPSDKPALTDSKESSAGENEMKFTVSCFRKIPLY